MSSVGRRDRVLDRCKGRGHNVVALLRDSGRLRCCNWELNREALRHCRAKQDLAIVFKYRGYWYANYCPSTSAELSLGCVTD